MSYVRTTTIRGRQYRYLVESVWDPKLKQARQRTVRYLGRVEESGGRALLRAPRPRVDSVERAQPIGRLGVYWAIAQELDLARIVHEVFGSRELADRFLVLVLNQLCHRKSLSKVVSWAEASPVKGWLGLGDLSRDGLEDVLHALCHVEDDVRVDAGAALQRRLTDAWRDRYGWLPAEAYYDLTKISYHGHHCSLAEKGYSPGGHGGAVVGVGLVVSRRDAFPILCRPIAGSRQDSVTLPDVVHALKADHWKGLTLVLDRGIVNAENVGFAEKNGFHILGGCPALSNDVLAAMGRFGEAELEQPAYAVRRPGGRTAYVRGWTGKLYGVPGRLVLVLDPVRRALERSERGTMLNELASTRDAKRSVELRAALGRLVRSARGRRGWVVDPQAVQRAQALDGRFLLYTTNARLTGADVFRIYLQKDEIEKVFRALKGELSLGPLRFRRPERIQAYLTLVFAAYLLRAVAAHRLRQARMIQSLDEALETLGSWTEVEFTSGARRIRWRTKPTKAQADLIKVFGLSKALPSG